MKDLTETLEKLAAFEPTDFPVISLYLNTGPDQHGRTTFEPFVRKELQARGKTYPLRSPERESFERDTERIHSYLERQLQPSAHALALFACSAVNDFFEALQLEVPIQHHRLILGPEPHLYPLARLNEQYRRYAAVVADTNSARLFVFGLGRLLNEQNVQSVKMNRTAAGGWSQARYQRHVDNLYLHHAKEVLEALDKMVREEKIEQIVLAGDEVVIPVLKEQMPDHLSEKVVDVLKLDMTTPENQVLQATLTAIRRQDARDDREKVKRLLDEYRAGNLGVVGAENTFTALELGQVDELILSASREGVQRNERTHEEADSNEEKSVETFPDILVSRALQTGAKVTFIEDPALLADIGGVGALLRYRIDSYPESAAVQSRVKEQGSPEEQNGTQKKQRSP
jgi:peptide chain release factor subunit 1